MGRTLLLVFVAATALVACTSVSSTEPAVVERVATDDAAARDEPVDTRADDTDDTGDTDEILEELLDAGFCDPEDVSGTGDIGDVTAMHFVVDALMQEPCAGTDDDRLDDAWQLLTDIAPHEYVADVSLLAGYEACEGCDTLAFVTSLDEDGTFFLMAIDVTAAQDDPDELLLTLLHELAHVFTQTPGTQLDVTVRPDRCDTYHNGNGCFTDGSYAWEWIQAFWDPEDLDGLVDGEPDEDAGWDRCDRFPSYTGPYGAGSPEEDLAEVFAAYVFDVDVDPALDPKLEFFDDRAEFREFRERAADLGLDGLPNTFEGCG